MMKLAALLISLATACTTADEGPVLHRVEAVSGELRDSLNFVAPDQLHESADQNLAFCSELPTEGLCADACDPDALAALIPKGECVVVACELADNTEIHVGGCHY